MNAKTRGHILIAVGLLGVGFTLFRDGNPLSGSWFHDASSLTTLIICMFVLTMGVRSIKK
jgi:hypothetical protein